MSRCLLWQPPWPNTGLAARWSAIKRELLLREHAVRPLHRRHEGASSRDRLSGKLSQSRRSEGLAPTLSGCRVCECLAQRKDGPPTLSCEGTSEGPCGSSMGRADLQHPTVYSATLETSAVCSPLDDCITQTRSHKGTQIAGTLGHFDSGTTNATYFPPRTWAAHAPDPDRFLHGFQTVV